MIRRVSRVSGTFGVNNDGRLLGSSPSSPTVGTVTAASTVKPVSATMATSGAGTTVETRGRPTMTAMPIAIIG